MPGWAARSAATLERAAERTLDRGRLQDGAFHPLELRRRMAARRDRRSELPARDAARISSERGPLAPNASRARPCPLSGATNRPGRPRMARRVIAAGKPAGSPAAADGSNPRRPFARHGLKARARDGQGMSGCGSLRPRSTPPAKGRELARGARRLRREAVKHETDGVGPAATAESRAAYCKPQIFPKQHAGPPGRSMRGQFGPVPSSARRRRGIGRARAALAILGLLARR